MTEAIAAGTSLDVHKLSAQEDEDVQKMRLLVQSGRFKALSNWFARFSREIERGSLAQSEVPLKSLAKDVIAMQYWFLKMEAVKAANKRDQDSYAICSAEQEVAIVQAQEDIGGKKAELEAARRVRQNNEDYERLRDQVMLHPARAATTFECEQLEQDILGLQAESERLDMTADLRRKQVALLLHCLDDLSTISTEEEEEEGAADPDQPGDENQPAPMEDAA